MIRGAPAVGKSTVCKEIMRKFRFDYKIKGAYIEEDNYRKQMQNWGKAAGLETHKNAVEIIESIIIKLLEIQDYEYIFIDGQFRYKEILDMYDDFIKENNHEKFAFQFNLNLEEMKKRDIELRNSKSPDIVELKKDIDAYIPKEIIQIKTSQPIEKTIKQVLNKIGLK